MQITIIGISDEQAPHLGREVMELIGRGIQFAGGERHFELVRDLLPDAGVWTNITVPLEPFLREMRGKGGSWIVFASGDPLFFGIGNTLKREFPDASFSVYPGFNNLQLLAHRMLLPYGTARVVTLTGRPWGALDKALIDGEALIGVLTDKVRTPAVIAERLIQFGYDCYSMVLGERLGGESERVRILSLSEALTVDYAHPNSLYLVQHEHRIIRRGIPDSEFYTLNGRPNMMTKMVVRLASLSAMELHTRSVFWDVGACTGSISVEAKLLNPLMEVHAFEVRKEGEELVLRNARKFGTPLTYHDGDFGCTDVSVIPQPDALFLGGYGGVMEQILSKVDGLLAEGGVVGFNAVSESSREQFLAWGTMHGYSLHSSISVQVDSHNPIAVMAMIKPKLNVDRKP